MFDGIIEATPFSNDIANGACSNISGADYSGDKSFVSTMRALLLPRIAEDETVEFIHMHKRFSRSAIADNSTNSLLDACIVGEMPNTISLTVFSRSDPNDNNALLDFIEENFANIYPVNRIEKVTHYFKKSFRCLCYVNPEIKQCFLFTEPLDYKLFHFLQVGILAFLPWYFDKESGVTPLEMELIESLRMKKSDKYIQCLEKIACLYDFRTEYTKKALLGLETRLERKKIKDLKYRNESLDQDILAYQNAISSYLQQMRDNNILIWGLEAKIKQCEENGIESEIMDYFLKNKRLYLQRADDSTFVFTVKDYLMFWDVDLAKKVFENKNSIAYNLGTTISGPYTREEMKELFEEIFVKENFRIKVCGTYIFNIEGMTVSAPTDYTYGYEFNDCMPNPHLDRYSCLGNYFGAISEFLKNNDYVGAIEQSVASCKSLNFTDTAVMNVFFHRWYKVGTDRSNVKCIELPNGEVVDPVGAIKYMREQKGESNGETD